jgi:hypothetical protein
MMMVAVIVGNSYSPHPPFPSSTSFNTISMKPHPGIPYTPKTAGIAECPALSAYPLK